MRGHVVRADQCDGDTSISTDATLRSLECEEFHEGPIVIAISPLKIFSDRSRLRVPCLFFHSEQKPGIILDVRLAPTVLNDYPSAETLSQFLKVASH